MAKVIGTHTSVDKDGNVQTLLAVATDLVGPNAQVKDEDKFQELVAETVKTLKAKYPNLDGAIYLPEPKPKRIIRT